MVRKSLASKRKNAFGYPKHTFLSYVVCFNESCINRAETVNYREKRRFKGYKNNKPIQKRPPLENEKGQPVIAQEREPQKLEINKVYTLKHVYFETGKARLNTHSQKELDQIVEVLQNDPTLIISVSGHTDNTGDEKENLELSQRRAEAVIDYLSAKGIATSRLIAKGYGSTKPLTSNDTEQGRENNRRVEFIIQANK
jgi:outer membrane protein OmpA-like peptidoglycan-associated protein